MKKYLAVFDGYKMSKSTMEYAIQLTRSEGAHLVGVFLDEILYHSYSVYEVLTTNANYEEVLEKYNAKDKRKRDDAAQQFKKACEKAKIDFSIHRDKNVTIQELKHESMFADLVIIDEFETFTRFREPLPTRFIKDLLSDVQCPVFITPEVFKPVDRIVLLYDGGPSSLHCIKMFSYIFSNMKSLPIEVYTVKEKKRANLRLPDNKLMREFIKRHFPQAKYTIVKGAAEEQVIEYLGRCKENVLVVLGAYQRSDLSRWFKTSMADILMKELDTPLFIAHNK
jgi:nucleotide-binding universal stress UspA family protein